MSKLPRFLKLQEEGSNHIFRLALEGGNIIGNYQILKRNGDQSIPFAASQCFTLEQVKKAWEKQGCKWIQLYKKDCDSPWVAMRFIILENGVKIGWFVRHKGERPADLLKDWGDRWTTEEIAAFYGFHEADYCGPEDSE